MNGRYALDTNIVIALIDAEVAVRDRVLAANEIFIPVPVLGELYFGAFRSGPPVDNAARIDDIVRWYATLGIDEATARIYGTIRSQLRAIGRPIPENDIWIAATAQQWAVTVATRDDHFLAIHNIAVEKW